MRNKQKIEEERAGRWQASCKNFDDAADLQAPP
jgi:hypothetical protein